MFMLYNVVNDKRFVYNFLFNDKLSKFSSTEWQVFYAMLLPLSILTKKDAPCGASLHLNHFTVDILRPAFSYQLSSLPVVF